MTFQLPTLNYDYSALEPSMDAKTMKIHHTKHHQGYVNKANAVLKETEWAEKTTADILSHLEDLPPDIRVATKDNVGGVCNHSFFWNCISPDGGGKPTGELATAITDTFGSFEQFKKQFTAAATGQFGSGWAWLVEKDEKLEIIGTTNQDSPLALGYKRLLALDVWEHAYYLNYQNRRLDYINAFWNVVDWDFVAAQR